MAIDILLLEMIKRISYAVILGSSFQGSNFSTVSWSTNYRGSTASPLRSFFPASPSSAPTAGFPFRMPLPTRDDWYHGGRSHWRPVPRHVRRYRVRLAPLFVGWFYGPCLCHFLHHRRFLAGLFQKYYKGKLIPWPIALGIGFFGEILQMLIILLVAQPYDQAYALVNSIAVPMTIANSLGLALFMYIIKAGLYQRTQQKANQSQNILSIARETVRYFRKGLNPDSANAVVQIIKKHSPYDAVSITDTKQVLAYIGAESNHHAPGMNDHLTHVTIDSLTSGTIHIAYSPAEIGCTHPNCTLSSAIVVPLMIKTRIIGTLKMYYTSPSYHPDSSDIAFAQGLADLFSTQLELTEIDTNVV